MDSCNTTELFAIKPESFLVLLLLVFSAWVLADPSLNLTLDEDLLKLNSSSILNNQDWRKEQPEENKWRTQPSDNPRENARWSNRSIYAEDEKALPGLTPLDDSMEGLIDDREAAPKFKLRF